MFAGNVYRHNIKGTWSNVSATRYAEYKWSGDKCWPRLMARLFYGGQYGEEAFLFCKR